ncbi:CDP-glycerol glycerophosphotransferase family protein [Neobacillus vireti]|uniref:Glycerophosphotransferase n=1 Tax=Neobacillus vireti LMG 21834 TaxID=1131730 RepID=A0AB94IQ90_9BACI|nr:CDP-glycerol glycerophosphotransferase family protein [Neobacillus vireti]ETI69167.1 putative glycerophosphotransferase [Neobacillus vireti LMG 21834]KLT15544.1 hypothetical protein AA980_23155 [Neobacillus vireti]
MNILDVKNSRLMVSTDVVESIKEIKINKKKIKHTISKTNEQFSEISFDDISKNSLNVFHTIAFYDKQKNRIDLQLNREGIFPFELNNKYQAVLVGRDHEMLIKFIDVSEILKKANKLDMLSLKVNILSESSSEINIGISDFSKNELNNLLLIAVQKETKISHLVPIAFLNEDIIIPKKYFSGVFDLFFTMIINSTIFKLTLDTSELGYQSFETELLEGKSPYRRFVVDNQGIIVESSNKSINVNFDFELTNIDHAYLLTGELIIEGEVEKQSIYFDRPHHFNNPDNKNILKLFLLSNGLMSIIDISEKTYTKEDTKEIESTVKQATNLDITKIEIEDTLLSFKIPSEISIPKKIQLLMRERKSKEFFFIEGNKAFDSLIFDFKEFLNGTDNKAERWDIYLVINAESEEKNVYRIGSFNDIIDDKPNRFYNFFKQSFDVKSTYNMYSRIYLTNKNQLSLVKGNISNLIKEQFEIKTIIDKFTMRKGFVNFRIIIKSSYLTEFDIGEIYLIQRNKDDLQKRRFEIKRIQDESNRRYIDCKIDLLKEDLFPLYWDFYLGIVCENKEYFIRVSDVSKKVLEDVNSTISKYQLSVNDGKEIIYPYVTLSNDLSFTYREREYFESSYYLLKENAAYYFYKLFEKYYAKKEIWVGFEKLAMSAHESGYYFFKYVYENKNQKDFYYVIRKDSPELKNLKGMEDKILYFMSFKYFVYMFAAKLLVSSDTKRNSYNLKMKKSKLAKELTDKKLVYLQHGVNGLKVVRDFYKDRGVFDLVIAPSEYERKMIIDHWGYNKSEVVTTGLSRWDALVDKTNEIKYRQIFVMPTWRTWMDGMTNEKFMESEYYQKYNEFLSSNKLDKLLKENNVKIMFFLHPKFKNYIDLFDFKSENIEKFGFLEVPLDEMIMKSSLMISDYSSVIWEMFYMKKPCVFYHFDRDKYLKYEGAYMDFENDLFGDVSIDADGLIDIVESYIKSDFKEKEEYMQLRKKYFTFIDKNNSERIYQEIQKHKKSLYKMPKMKKWKFTHVIPFKVRRKILDIIKK